MPLYPYPPDEYLVRTGENTVHYKYSCTCKMYVQVDGVEYNSPPYHIFPVQYGTAGTFAAGFVNRNDIVVFGVDVTPGLTELGLKYKSDVYYAQDGEQMVETYYSDAYIPYVDPPTQEGTVLNQSIEFTVNIEMELETDLHSDAYLIGSSEPFARHIDYSCGYAKGWAHASAFYVGPGRYVVDINGQPLYVYKLKRAKYTDSAGNSLILTDITDADFNFIPTAGSNISVVDKSVVIGDGTTFYTTFYGKDGDDHLTVTYASDTHKYDIIDRTYSKSGTVPNSDNLPPWVPKTYDYYVKIFNGPNGTAVLQAHANRDFWASLNAGFSYDMKLLFHTIDTENKPISGVQYYINDTMLPKGTETPIITSDNEVDLHYKSNWTLYASGEYTDGMIPNTDPLKYNEGTVKYDEHVPIYTPSTVRINNVETLGEPAATVIYKQEQIYTRDSRLLISPTSGYTPNLESSEILRLKYNGEQEISFGDISKWTAHNCTMTYNNIINAFVITDVQEGAYIQCDFAANDIVWGLFGSRFFKMRYIVDTENARLRLVCDDVNSWSFKAESVNVLQEQVFDSCFPSGLTHDSIIDNYKWVSANQTMLDDYKPFDMLEHDHDSRKAFGVQTVDKVKIELLTPGAEYTIYQIKHKVYNKPRIHIIPGCAYCSAPLPSYLMYPFGGDDNGQERPGSLEGLGGEHYLHRNAVIEVDGKFILEAISGHIRHTVNIYPEYEDLYSDGFDKFRFYASDGTKYVPYFVPTDRNIYDIQYNELDEPISFYQNRGQIKTNGLLTVETLDAPSPHAKTTALQISLSPGKVTSDSIDDELKLSVAPQVDTIGFTVLYHESPWTFYSIPTSYLPGELKIKYFHVYGAIVFILVVDSFRKPVSDAEVTVSDFKRTQKLKTDSVGLIIAHVRPGYAGEIYIENQAFPITNRMFGRAVLIKTNDGYLLYDINNDKLHFRQTNGYLERDKEDDE